MPYRFVTTGARLPGGNGASPAPSGSLDAEPGERDAGLPPPGQDATLLAVVPIPGTGTSLAIVGYVISASAERKPGHEHKPDRENQPEWTAAGPEPAAEPDRDSGLVLDHAQRRVWADGHEIMLTFQEFELLAFLSAHPATVFSRADLLARVWPAPAGLAPDSRIAAPDSRTVDVHISRLRRKLGPVYAQCVVTEHRVGYQLRPWRRD